MSLSFTVMLVGIAVGIMVSGVMSLLELDSAAIGDSLPLTA